MNAQPLAYFNHAGASLMSTTVRNTIVSHLEEEMRLGGYGAEESQQDAIQAVYNSAAELLGCAASEVALTDSHSRGWREVMNCLHFSAGDRILIARSEWGGNYAALAQIAQRDGASIDIMPCTPTGDVCIKQLANILDRRVRLISLTWLPANGGLIQPAEQIGTLARAADIPFFIDAAQAVGQIPVDVRALNCDVLTAPGRKWLRGPRGTGLLYVRQGYLSQLSPLSIDHFSAPLVHGNYVLRQDVRRFETSEANMAARLGLGQAIRETLSIGVDAVQKIVREKADKIRSQLNNMPHVIHQDLGTEHSGLIAFTVNKLSAHEVRAHLRRQQIEIAVNGVAFTPLDMRSRGLSDIARISPHITTTDEEISRLVHALSHLGQAAR